MKKNIFLSAAALMALGLASCSSDAPDQPVAGDGVQFRVSLGQLGTRAAFADGLQADRLDYAVYDLDGKFVLQGDANFGNALETTVSIPLVNGLGYQIAFFAHQGDGAYTFDAEGGKFTADYTKIGADNNSVDHDAFFKLETIEKVDGAMARTVTLKRPVARINWGTSDLESPAVTHETAYGEDAKNLTSKVTVKGVYTTFNMLEQKVEGELTDVEFVAQARPQTTATLAVPAFPYEPETYDYVSMQYVLVPAESAVVDAEWTPYCNGQEMPKVTVPNCPVQANYNTNIFGALLTSPVDFKVIKNEIFDAPDYGVEWNGSVDTDLPVDEDTKTITINNAEQLAGFAKRVNDGESFRYYTINLTSDVDLNNVVWTPIGNLSHGFAGVFDGQNHTISNLNAVPGYSAKQGNECAGLFGAASLQVGTSERCVIKNLKIENATVKSGHYAGVIVGWTNSGVDITNCEVNNATVVCSYKNADDSGDKAGGIAGYFYGGTIDKCKVSNASVTATRDLGGIAGMLQINVNSERSSVAVTNCSISDSEVIAKPAEAGKAVNAGEIAGRTAAQRVTLSNNTVSNVTVTAPIVDGLTQVGNTFELSKPAGLVEISRMVAANPNAFLGKTIKMTADIDMAGIDFTPIANSVTSYPSSAFSGTFDGAGHVISNLKASSSVKNYAAAGLFGAVVGGKTVIKNVTLKNPAITSTHYAGGIAGYCSNNTGLTIQNCKVIGGTITSAAENLGSEWDNGDKVGGIIGFNDNGDFVKDCVVDGVAIKGYRHVGGIVGFTNNMNNYSGNTVKNVVITQDDTHDYKNFNGAPTSTIFGPVYGNNTAAGSNTVENVKYPTF